MLYQVQSYRLPKGGIYAIPLPAWSNRASAMAERPYNLRCGVRWRCVYTVYSQVRPFIHDRICILTLGVTFAQTPYHVCAVPDIQYPEVRGTDRPNPGDTSVIPVTIRIRSGRRNFCVVLPPNMCDRSAVKCATASDPLPGTWIAPENCVRFISRVNWTINSKQNLKCMLFKYIYSYSQNFPCTIM